LFNPYQRPIHSSLVAALHHGLTSTSGTATSLGTAEHARIKLAKLTHANLDGLFGILHMQKIFCFVPLARFSVPPGENNESLKN
jgi:hypothetical protein